VCFEPLLPFGEEEYEPAGFVLLLNPTYGKFQITIPINIGNKSKKNPKYQKTTK
jgi:hypothetical protein